MFKVETGVVAHILKISVLVRQRRVVSIKLEARQRYVETLSQNKIESHAIWEAGG